MNLFYKNIVSNIIFCVGNTNLVKYKLTLPSCPPPLAAKTKNTEHSSQQNIPRAIQGDRKVAPPLLVPDASRKKVRKKKYFDTHATTARQVTETFFNIVYQNPFGKGGGRILCINFFVALGGQSNVGM